MVFKDLQRDGKCSWLGQVVHTSEAVQTSDDIGESWKIQAPVWVCIWKIQGPVFSSSHQYHLTSVQGEQNWEEHQSHYYVVPNRGICPGDPHHSLTIDIWRSTTLSPVSPTLVSTINFLALRFWNLAHLHLNSCWQPYHWPYHQAPDLTDSVLTFNGP